MWYEGVPNDKEKEIVTQTENQFTCTKTWKYCYDKLNHKGRAKQYLICNNA